MPRSRAPRHRLTAVLLLVLGVLAVALCGPVTTASAAPTTAAAPAAPAAPAKKVPAPAFTDGSAVPGCQQGGRHQDSDPAAPVRTRTAHDQAPVLEDRVAHAALGALYAAHRNPPVRGPTRSAPTPVELSVLRV
ncbi:MULTISPECIES: hypothetical protein [Streptomyces]|uniref:hypothetical protein n=1 Tax=Streptomyces TaxID=1883 RepID=UPI0014220D00|nr:MULTISPECIES: hypothetical protein [Streptomyces]